MALLTKMTRPIVRRISGLVVRVSFSGVEYRRYRTRTWRSVSWAQIAAAADGTEPIIRNEETTRGLAKLSSMGVVIDEPEEATDEPDDDDTFQRPRLSWPTGEELKE